MLRRRRRQRWQCRSRRRLLSSGRRPQCAHFGNAGSEPAILPGAKHYQRPKTCCFLTITVEKAIPLSSHRISVQKSVSGVGEKKVTCPAAKRTSQPPLERNGESHLLAIHKRRRDVVVQHLSQ